MQFHDDLSEAQCDRVHHLGHQMNEYVVDLISFVQRMRTCIEQSIRTLSPEETPSRLTTTLERLFAQLDGMVDTCETVKTNNLDHLRLMRTLRIKAVSCPAEAGMFFFLACCSEIHSSPSVQETGSDGAPHPLLLTTFEFFSRSNNMYENENAQTKKNITDLHLTNEKQHNFSHLHIPSSPFRSEHLWRR